MKKFIKKIKSLNPVYDKVSSKILTPMEYNYKGKDILVEIETQEFTCICPWSKLPDFATVRIKYIPDKYCVELKSLKYYLQSFRNVGIVHENVVNKIFEDLYNLLEPKWLYVELEFNLRGGLKTTVKREFNKG
jgi:7-cyano-7-deazaguanine reductase